MEEWKDIKGYEGLYQVSNYGNIKSLKRNIILSPAKAGRGYYYVLLCKNGKPKLKYIHRLVAEHFVPNPNSYKEVNHKSGIKSNNDIFNLEWCTHKQNCEHKTRILKKGCKKVRQYDLQGVFIKEWASISEAKRTLNISHIGECCSSKIKTAGGYMWRYE